MSPYRPLTLATAIALLGGCATIPKPLEGNYTNLSTANAQQGDAGGTPVRWGGEIIKTEPGPQQTCFFILSRPLNKQARPESGTDGQDKGRFVACRAGFYDPQVFTRGRNLTVTGTLHGTVSQKVGKYDYAYPLVEANVVYLWPKRPIAVGYRGGIYNPYWGSGWAPGYYSAPYWGGGWDGGWDGGWNGGLDGGDDLGGDDE